MEIAKLIYLTIVNPNNHKILYEVTETIFMVLTIGPSPFRHLNLT